MDAVALGVFVGGRSSRMGRAKGRLPAPAGGESLVERLVRLGRAVALEPVLVGAAADYEGLVPEVPRIADDPPGVGPIGGLRGLLRMRPVAVVVACDMPAVDAELLVRLRDGAGVMAPRLDRWEPLCARYEASLTLPAIEAALREEAHSLQGLLDRIGATAIAVDGTKLVDWDRPADVTSDPRGG